MGFPTVYRRQHVIISLSPNGAFMGSVVKMRRKDLMYEKAVKLVQSRRVEFLGNGAYNIIGDHGTYTVVQDFTGNLSCSCPGYLQKQRCSHVKAVELMTRHRQSHR